ncbi:hypothetical protein JL720_14709 [Aureococcus anophagefferens]|nr:hypothetical protein JL720_14709 [Aureococcus anophagefferens]
MAALEVCSLEDEVDYGIESDHDDAPAAAPASSAPPADDAEAAAPAAAAADAADDGAAGGDAAAAADAPSERKNGKAKEKPSSPRDGKDKDKKRDKDKKADAALKTPRVLAAKTEYGKFTGLAEAMAADGVVTAKASTGSGANNGGGLQITAVRRATEPRAVAGARTMADGDGADEAPPASPRRPEPAPEPAPPPPPAPEVDDARPEVDDAARDRRRPTSGERGAARVRGARGPAAPVDESAAARGPAPWPGDDSDPTKLFAGAPAQTDADRARNHFSQFSEVLDAIVMKDRDTRQSRGFGFAEKTASATTEQAASAGIKKLYVANLTTRSTEQEMTDAFAPADPQCAVMRHSDTGESRGFGFVTYETHEAAAKAVAAQPVQVGSTRAPSPCPEHDAQGQKPYPPNQRRRPLPGRLRRRRPRLRRRRLRRPPGGGYGGGGYGGGALRAARRGGYGRGR